MEAARETGMPEGVFSLVYGAGHAVGQALVRHPAVTGGWIDTGYLDRHLDEFMPAPSLASTQQVALVAAELLWQEARARAQAGDGDEPDSPWAIADGWRLGHAGARPLAFAHLGQTWTALAHGHGGRYRIELASGLLTQPGSVIPAQVMQVETERPSLRAHVERWDEGMPRFSVFGNMAMTAADARTTMCLRSRKRTMRRT